MIMAVHPLRATHDPVCDLPFPTGVFMLVSSIILSSSLGIVTPWTLTFLFAINYALDPREMGAEHFRKFLRFMWSLCGVEQKESGEKRGLWRQKRSLFGDL